MTDLVIGQNSGLYIFECAVLYFRVLIKAVMFFIVKNVQFIPVYLAKTYNSEIWIRKYVNDIALLIVILIKII
jgi:hypothetical protein